MSFDCHLYKKQLMDLDSIELKAEQKSFRKCIILRDYSDVEKIIELISDRKS